MTNPQVKPGGNWISARADVNLVSIAALAGVWVSVHEALFFSVGRATWTERGYLQLIVVAQSIWLTAWTGLAVAVGRGTGFRRTARALTALSFAGPAVLYVDAIVRAHSGLHLIDLVPIALDGHVEDNRRILEATGVDGLAAAAFLACVVPAVAAAAWFDAKTESFGLRVASRIQPLTRGLLGFAWLGAFAVLANLELGASRTIHMSSWLRFERAVPQLLGALGPAPGVQASVRVAARPGRSEASVAAGIARLDFPTDPPGDVFFFVVDSLRADAVTPTLTPALATLAAESLPIDVSLSGGNATHLGWYSLFSADSALAWRLDPNRESASGPVPLQLARRRGWRIEVLSTPDLGYMNLDRSILGEGKRLADSVLDLHDQTGANGAKDTQIVDEVMRRMATPHAPTAYLVFLDATHVPYSWADDFNPPIRPFAGPVHYMQVQWDPPDRAAVLARYDDSVAFVDSILGRFLQALRASGHFDDATVVVTGDHGEEFWEHGLVGHGSELCRVQTRVALLLKLPKKRPPDGDWSSRKALARAMDVWPTLLDASGVRGETTALFDGVSLAREAHRTALIAGMRYWYPSSRFVLDDGERRVLFELTHPDDPLLPQRLDVLSLLDGDDVPTHPDLTSAQYQTIVESWFGADLDQHFTVTW